ncbi:hypothetical protein Tco_0575800 [Tanacetum coccineum]
MAVKPRTKRPLMRLLTPETNTPWCSKRILSVVAATVGEGGEGDGGVGVKVVTMVTRWWRSDGVDKEEMKECGIEEVTVRVVAMWWLRGGSGSEVVLMMVTAVVGRMLWCRRGGVRRWGWCCSGMEMVETKDGANNSEPDMSFNTPASPEFWWCSDPTSTFDKVLSLSSSSYFPAMSKNDMKDRICTISKNDLKDLVKTYRIPLDLHPRLPDPRFTMDRLPADAIGIYSEFLGFSGVRVPISTFLLSVLKYFKVHISQLVPLGLNKVVSFEVVCRDLNIVPTVTLFCVFQYRRAVPDYLTWRHSCSSVSDDLPSDGYDRNDVQQLCARLIHLRVIRDEVLVRSGLKMSIYDFMNLPSWSDAKIVEESHHLSLPLLKRVPSHTTTLAAEGAMVPFPTLDEIVASLSDPRLAKKSKGPVQARVHLDSKAVAEPSRTSKKRKLKRKASEVDSNAPELGQAEGMDDANLTNFCAEIEDSLEKDEGASTRAASAPIPRLGKRLGAPPSMAVVSASEPYHVGTSAHAFISGRSLSFGGAAVSGHAGKSRAEVLRRQVDPLDFLARSALACDVEYDQIPEDDIGTATRGEEINLTLFPLAPGPYHMPYPYEGVSSPLYTKKEWDGPHAPECNILCKDIFKDPDVCRKALDRTITPAKLKRTESLLPLELSNRVNVLSALLVSHGYELNSRYTNLVSSSAHLQEKLDKKKGDNELVLEKSKSQGYKDAIDGLREEVTQFVGSGVESLVWKLLSSDEFHAALACVASLGINYGVERGLRMGRTDVEFEATAQKVLNFHVGAKADFDKALDDFPTTPFPFLSKIVAASEGSLFDVA